MNEINHMRIQTRIGSKNRCMIHFYFCIRICILNYTLHRTLIFDIIKIKASHNIGYNNGKDAEMSEKYNDQTWS